MKHVDIRVIGKVQGVFFRASTKNKADELGLVGTVKNEPNGDVTIEAEGQEEMIQPFLQWCARGPKNAVVENLIVTEGDPKNFKGFFVLR
ncbi:MAG TPA: acylphosphatase [Cytophagales bacterium]|nr:acylphosphatase [Cytophagales bacterium]